MVTVTLSRGSKSVDIPLVEESGTPLFSTDLGLPFANTRNGGSIDPITEDRWSAQINHTLQGRFTSASAYDDAITLADLIKEDPDGNDLELSGIPFDEYDDPMTVAPQAGNEQAVTLEYPSGRTNHVTFSLGLTEIGTSITGAGRDDGLTPTAAGSGPIQLQAGGKTVDLVNDVSVSRSVGRPKDSATKTPNQLGRYIYKFKTAYDGLSLSFELTDNTITTLNTIATEIFQTRLGRSGITLDFQGKYGLGAFDVLPTGSAPVRYQRLAGWGEGQVSLPTLEFRVIKAL